MERIARIPEITAQLDCLLGGAIGDALGYRVEFDRWPEIERKYGPAGIELASAQGPLIVSDDTQMTLFTLEGMAHAASIDGIVDEIREAYLDWLGTQGLASTAQELKGRLAGCDVMRTAPLGFLPAGAMATLVRCALDGVPWDQSIAKALTLARTWPRSDGTVAAITSAAEAAAAGPPSRRRVSELGQGWVGEEALAVGLYAANHDGDSDSTASIAGQLWGARFGLT